MSDFKVGDKVKCVRADNLCGKLTKGKTYTITSIVTGITYTGGSSVCVDGNRDDWWYSDRFELIPQPAESRWLARVRHCVLRRRFPDNDSNHGVAACDLTIRKRMDRNSRALHC